MTGTSRVRIDDDPVVVVGLSFEFPGEASTPESFLKMLYDRRATMTEIPQDRFNIDAFFHPDVERLDTLNCRGANFMERDITAFDAPFFSISPTEAESLDPQQRFLLETTYKALENAGLSIYNIAGSNTSVYVGSMARDYDVLIQRDPLNRSKYAATGTGSAMLANRLSWFYDLRGASLTLDTACSSSMHAFHLACQDLRRGDSTISLVGASNLILDPDTVFIPLANLGFLSPDSYCHSFDRSANGYARGEGVGVLVLKLLSQALECGDTIRAVVRGTSLNQDGKTPGITQPSLDAQKHLITSCYREAGLDLSQTRFFEAHGTGTTIGDSIEARAIHEVFGVYRSTEEPMIVGAVKSNIGHLEGASALAGLIKTILILEKGQIPPNYGFETPGPDIHEEEWHLQFPKQTIAWPIGIRRASINSFGYGGANSHVILDDAYHYLKDHGYHGAHATVKDLQDGNVLPGLETSQRVDDLPTGSQDSDPKLLVFSSNDQKGIHRTMVKYTQYLSSQQVPANQVEFMSDLAYTLASRRTHLAWRTFLVADSIQEALKITSAGSHTTTRSQANAKCAFIFSGQGSLWNGMGRQLLKYPVFLKTMQAADDFLQEQGCSWSLLGKLHLNVDSDEIHETRISQPLCTALQIAQIELLGSWNIHPELVVGHSSGEIAAAYAAGAITMHQALELSYWRGHLASTETIDGEGAMIAVAASKLEIEALLSDLFQPPTRETISIGCVNGPNSVTVTGSRSSVIILQEYLDQNSIISKLLPINVAYHCGKMRAVALPYKEALLNGTFSRPTQHRFGSRKMFSSVTGKQIDLQEVQKASYWVENLLSPVLFEDALGELGAFLEQQAQADPSGSFGDTAALIEVGPRAALRRPVMETLRAKTPSLNFVYSSMLRASEPACRTALELAGQLHCLGLPIDLSKANHFDSINAKPQLIVDLPGYSFNHEGKHWCESRLSADARFRRFPRHDLLGVQSREWNPLEAKWRHIISYKENPWIADHRLNEVTEGATLAGSEEQDTQLYPFGAMLAMAIEASRQLVKPSSAIRGFRLRKVKISKALDVSMNAAGTETEFFMRRQLAENSKSKEGFDFRLLVLKNNDWLEVVTGQIQVEFLPSANEGATGVGGISDHPESQLLYGEMLSLCEKKRESIAYYGDIRRLGFDFGSSFNTLDQIAYSGEGHVISSVRLNTAGGSEDSGYVVHPCALDAMFQLVLAAISNGGTTSIPFIVPTSLDELWVSHKLLAPKNLELVNACAEVGLQGFRQTQGQFVAFDPGSGEELIVGKGYIATALSNLMESSHKSKDRKLGFKIEWKPSISTMDANELTTTLESTGVREHVQGLAKQVLEMYCASRLEQATTEIRKDELPPEDTHLHRYYEWAQKALTNYALRDSVSSELSDVASTEVREMFANAPEWRLYSLVGENLPTILRGRSDALELFFGNRAAEDFYAGSVLETFYRSLAVYVDILAHQNCSMNILEVGAGVGSATLHVLGKIGSQTDGITSAPRFAKYVYSDVSPGFFEAAQKRFGDQCGYLQYKVFDIEKDATAQGFEAEHFDLIIASGVVHATKNLEDTLRNLKELLKASGSIVIIEPTDPGSILVNFCFGLLPGWWLSQDPDRAHGPLLTTQGWERKLRESGFTGLEATVQHASSGIDFGFSMLVSSPTPSESSQSQIDVTFIGAQSDFQDQVMEFVSTGLRGDLSYTLRRVDITDVAALENLTGPVVSLIDCELKASDFKDSNRWRALKILSSPACQTLWIAKCNNEHQNGPIADTMIGLARSLRSENANNRFKTVVFKENTAALKVAKRILKLIPLVFDEASDVDCEYKEVGELLCCGRVTEAQELNRSLACGSESRVSEPRSLGANPNMNISLKIRSPGLLDSLYFQEELLPEDMIPSDMVEIDVKAQGLNFKDILVALGQVPETHIGQDCSGVVIDVGSSVTDLQVGDRVFCVSNTFKRRIRVRGEMVGKISNDLTYCEAASIPVVFCTAYYAIHNLAHLTSGESILIHSGAGGLGQAAIQLSQRCGAEVFVTVGTNEKKRFVIDRFGLTEDHVFYSRDASFSRELKKIKPDGVDVVLNSLSGELLETTWNCIAPLGRFVEVGKRDILNDSQLPMKPFSRNVAFMSVDLGLVALKARQLMKKIVRDVADLLSMPSNGISTPRPVHIFEPSEVEDAFRFLQTGRSTGKVVINLESDAKFSILPSNHPIWKFSADATYVLAGGLGGIGLSIVRWMVERGAKHFLLLSRSGEGHRAAASVREELAKKGAKMSCPSCDISDVNVLHKALTDYEKHGPPIRGCIQGAMVLQDGLFESMSLEEFDGATRVKVAGSWNLHRLLPRGMDFFILLSSTAGIIGSRGQCNYAAGNTYQDELARFRVSHGEKAASIDLGLVLTVGYAAERNQVTRVIQAAGYEGIEESEIHSLMEYWCDPDRQIASPDECQVITDLVTPATLRKRGIPLHYWMRNRIFDPLGLIDHEKSSSSGVQESKASLSSLLLPLTSRREAATVIAKEFAEKLSRSLAVPVTDIDFSRPVHSFGVDSLVAVEIRYWFLKEAYSEIRVMEIMGSTSAADLCLLAAGRSQLCSQLK